MVPMRWSVGQSLLWHPSHMTNQSFDPHGQMMNMDHHERALPHPERVLALLESSVVKQWLVERIVFGVSAGRVPIPRDPADAVGSAP
jgi:hypothetical protein